MRKVLRPASHLSFAAPSVAAPPPPMLFSVGASPSVRPAAEKAVKKNQRKRVLDESLPIDSNPVASVNAAPPKVEQLFIDERASVGSSQTGRAVAAAPQPKKKQRVADHPTAALPPATSSPTTSAAVAASVGMDANHVLLVLGVPAGMSELELQRHFAACAPSQIRLLQDWSTKQPRGAACLALASARAVELALRPALATLGGSRIHVCTAATSAKAEEGFGGTLSAPMRQQLAALETKAKGAVGSANPAQMLPAPTLRHLLLTCEVGAANAAVDEFCAVARSGTPKQPGGLLCACLLKHRRLTGGDVWLGRVNGLPLPRAEAARMRELLDALDWSAMPADGKLRGEMAEQSFKLGLSTKVWAKQNGPYLPFAFKAGMGVWDAASVTKKHKQLWEAASALISAADPTYPWTSVQFNKNFRGSRHRDDKDATYQVATAFGEYEGGELRVHGQDGILDVNTRDRFVRFDGRFEHEVLPYSGLRYSVIFFALAPPWSVDPSSTEEGCCR